MYLHFAKSMSCRNFTAHEKNFILSTLNDPRSWGFAWAETSVARKANWSVSLESQANIDSISKAAASTVGLSVTFMATRPRVTLFSLQNWTTRPEPASEFASQNDYRHYLVNHECGHALGLQHSPKVAAGNKSPVMHQQSRGFFGMKPNPWPTPAESSTVHKMYGM